MIGVTFPARRTLAPENASGERDPVSDFPMRHFFANGGHGARRFLAEDVGTRLGEIASHRTLQVRCADCRCANTEEDAVVGADGGWHVANFKFSRLGNNGGFHRDPTIEACFHVGATTTSRRGLASECATIATW